MYMEDYKRWMETELEDAALTAELQSIEGNEEDVSGSAAQVAGEVLAQCLNVQAMGAAS